jgi:AraC family transcriptional regulator
MPTLSIKRQDLSEQPYLFIRRRIAGRHEIAATLGECFGKLYAYDGQLGLAEVGRPLARYISMGPGQWTIEAGKPLAAPTTSAGEIQVGTLPGGPTALAVHAGPYEELPQTYIEMERWIEANGYRTNGAPWESYVTDPGEYPNPADWRTEVYWPITK